MEAEAAESGKARGLTGAGVEGDTRKGKGRGGGPGLTGSAESRGSTGFQMGRGKGLERQELTGIAVRKRFDPSTGAESAEGDDKEPSSPLYRYSREFLEAIRQSMSAEGLLESPPPGVTKEVAPLKSLGPQDALWELTAEGGKSRMNGSKLASSSNNSTSKRDGDEKHRKKHREPRSQKEQQHSHSQEPKGEELPAWMHDSGTLGSVAAIAEGPLEHSEEPAKSDDAEQHKDLLRELGVVADEEGNGAQSKGDEVASQGWEYKDPTGRVHGPFSSTDILDWHDDGYFPRDLEIRAHYPGGSSEPFQPLYLLLPTLRADASEEAHLSQKTAYGHEQHHMHQHQEQQASTQNTQAKPSSGGGPVNDGLQRWLQSLHQSGRSLFQSVAEQVGSGGGNQEARHVDQSIPSSRSMSVGKIVEGKSAAHGSSQNGLPTSLFQAAQAQQGQLPPVPTSAPVATEGSTGLTQQGKYVPQSQGTPRSGEASLLGQDHRQQPTAQDILFGWQSAASGSSMAASPLFWQQSVQGSQQQASTQNYFPAFDLPQQQQHIPPQQHPHTFQIPHQGHGGFYPQAQEAQNFAPHALFPHARQQAPPSTPGQMQQPPFADQNQQPMLNEYYTWTNQQPNVDQFTQPQQVMQEQQRPHPAPDYKQPPFSNLPQHGPMKQVQAQSIHEVQQQQRQQQHQQQLQENKPPQPQPHQTAWGHQREKVAQGTKSLRQIQEEEAAIRACAQQQAAENQHAAAPTPDPSAQTWAAAAGRTSSQSTQRYQPQSNLYESQQRQREGVRAAFGHQQQSNQWQWQRQMNAVSQYHQGNDTQWHAPPEEETQASKGEQHVPKEDKTGFWSWCSGALEELVGSRDTALAEFLMTLGSAAEVQEYCRLYLGDTPAALQFANDFLKWVRSEPSLLRSAGSKSSRRRRRNRK